MKNSEKNLRNTLKVNAIFSLMCGILLMVCRNFLANLMNINQANILFGIGVGLLIFVILLLYPAFSPKLAKNHIKFIILQDWLWVIGSFILLILNPFEISLIGNILILVIALVVMSFAIMQGKFIQKI